MSEFKYRAFISYSHQDEGVVRSLHRRLERYRVPPRVARQLPPERARLRPIFRDRDELSAAGSLSEAIIEALDAAEFLIVACSPAAVASTWVNQEILHFKRSGREDRVLCVLVGGDGGADQLFPEAARFALGEDGELDFGAPVEPLAADLRASGDGLRAGPLKLIAALLGVDFDELVQRESARRSRQLGLIAAGTTVGMVLTAVLATYAVLQRNEAEAQRAAAETEARTLGEVVDFMVGIFEVANPATQDPATITALEILDRGAKRLDTDLSDQPEIRGRLLATVGRVYFGLGLFDESGDRLEEAVAQLRPGSLRAVEAQLQLAKTLLRRQEFGQAERMFAGVVDDLEQRFPDANAALGEAFRWWGGVRFYQNDYAGAEARYLAAIAAFERGDQRLAAEALSRINLANVYIDEGRLTDADQLLAAALSLLEELFGPDHADTAYARHSIGLLRAKQGRHKEGIDALQGAVAAWRSVLGDTHPDVVTGQLTLGFALRENGQLAAAQSVLAEGLAAGAQSVGRDSLQYALIALELAGAMADAGGDLSAAGRLVDEAQETIGTLFTPDSTYQLNLLMARADIAKAAQDAPALRVVCAEMQRRLREAAQPTTSYDPYVADRCGSTAGE